MTFQEDIDNAKTVYYGGIALYAFMGILCVMLDQLHMMLRSKKKHRKVKWIRDYRWQTTLLLVVGTLYITGDNLDLLIPLELDIVINETTQIRYADLRGYLLGISLVLGLVLIIPTFYGEGLVAKEGHRQNELISIHDMIVCKLFPMLIFTIQLDQIYTTIAGEVVHQRNEVIDGTLCPRNYVIGGIIFYVAVCLTWIGVVCVVIGKYIYTLRCFKQDNYYESIEKHIWVLVISIVTLVLYTPAYIALNNKWPWICAAKCKVQEVCIIDAGELCTYVTWRTTLLSFLSLFTAILAYIYFKAWYTTTERDQYDVNTEGLGARQKSAKGANKE